ncbi:MAG: hypothetical protein WCH11_07145, partial [Bdellovibrio sp.]
RLSAEQSPLRWAPFTADMVMSNEWKFAFSREQAAFPRPWVRSNKFWPSVGRIDNAYGDRNIFCSCPPLDEFRALEANS